MSDEPTSVPNTIEDALERSLLQIKDKEFLQTVTLGFLAGAAAMLAIASREALTTLDHDEQHRRMWMLDAALDRLFVTAGLPTFNAVPRKEQH